MYWVNTTDCSESPKSKCNRLVWTLGFSHTSVKIYLTGRQDQQIGAHHPHSIVQWFYYSSIKTTIMLAQQIYPSFSHADKMISLRGQQGGVFLIPPTGRAGIWSHGETDIRPSQVWETKHLWSSISLTDTAVRCQEIRKVQATEAESL